MKTQFKKEIMFAVWAALLYALGTPFSKVLLQRVSPGMMAAFLYLGAGFGMLIFSKIPAVAVMAENEKALEKKDGKYIAVMILLDILAPILLLYGLDLTDAASASLLNNLEIVTTALAAMVLFGEKISGMLWMGIVFVTGSGILLSYRDQGGGLQLSAGALLIIGACICWGIENNCTRSISAKNPYRIVIIKGLGSGVGALIFALALGEGLPEIKYIPFVLILGFISYGLSIFFYIKAQRKLGAAKTSTFYAAAPFMAAGISMLVFKEMPGHNYGAAIAIMALGTIFVVADHRHDSG